MNILKSIVLLICFLILVSINTYAQTSLKQYSDKTTSPLTQFTFIENKGQLVDQNGNKRDDVLYYFNSNGFRVRLKKNGFSIELKDKAFDKTVLINRVDIDFINPAINVNIIPEHKKTFYFNSKYMTKNHSSL